MGIRSILVNIDPTNPNSPSLGYAIDLARMFEAELIGIAADHPNPAYLGIDSGGAAVEFYTAERSAVEEQLAHAEAIYNSVVPAAIKRQWRAYIAPPTSSLLDCAAIADLIVTPSSVTNTFGDTQKVSLGEIVLGAGRPVLDVGAAAAAAKFDKIVIGWKNTREARRAVSDALPFLTRAKEVIVLTVSEGNHPAERESLETISGWLVAHGVANRVDVLRDDAGQGDLLQVTALQQQADLLVTGAYGHTRMREWLFGGMTRSVLETEGLNRLLSN